MLSRAPELEMVALSRRTNDGQVGMAIKALQQELGGLEGVPILVLGLTYRHGVKELAYSRALPLIERLTHLGAVVSAYDPLLTAAETAACCASAWAWGTTGPYRAIVTQTADPLFGSLDPAWFPDLAVLFDGRDSLRSLALPETVAYRGIGIPGRARAAVATSS
jgi:UDP-N-acetyl-D-mannosaminuronate dehydrogenase